MPSRCITRPSEREPCGASAGRRGGGEPCHLQGDDEGTYNQQMMLLDYTSKINLHRLIYVVELNITL